MVYEPSLERLASSVATLVLSVGLANLIGVGFLLSIPFNYFCFTLVDLS